jgi:hypothetical protein
MNSRVRNPFPVPRFRLTKCLARLIFPEELRVKIRREGRQDEREELVMGIIGTAWIMGGLVLAGLVANTGVAVDALSRGISGICAAGMVSVGCWMVETATSRK